MDGRDVRAVSHTPAPWNVEIHPVTGQFVIQARYKIHDTDAYCCVAVLNSAAPSRDANANLLASAPDMLAALKRVAAWRDVVSTVAPELGGLISAIENAIAAISKAEADHA